MDSSKMMLTALKFNDMINQQDTEGLAELMTEDHTFIDSDGATSRGRDVMKKAWGEFFRRYPDYRNMFTSVTVQNDVIVIIGYSVWSFKPLNGSNMWTARVRDGRVSEWRVSWLDRRHEHVKE